MTAFREDRRGRCSLHRAGASDEGGDGRIPAVVLRVLDRFPEVLGAVVEALRAEVAAAGR